MPSIPIVFGQSCPHPDTLETGDLLFPRVPDNGGGSALFEYVAIGAIGDKRLRDALGIDGVELLESNTPGHTLTTVDDEVYDDSGGVKVFDPSNVSHLLLLLKILKISFKDIVGEWLDMTVREFIKHPISRILIGAINKDLGQGFFVGHCAMVFREPGTAREAGLYVIEANITDFSHYRVSIHPYYSHDEVTLPGVGRKRGWVNYRAALGQKVWSARPQALMAATADAAATNRHAIIPIAKQQLGRPYGFFDHPELGDSDRLYCSEFVLTVFRQLKAQGGLDISVEDRRTWKWLLENLGDDEFRKKLIKDLKESYKDGVSLYDRLIGQPFFLLTVHMLWRSQALSIEFIPPGEGPYA